MVPSSNVALNLKSIGTVVGSTKNSKAVTGFALRAEVELSPSGVMFTTPTPKFPEVAGTRPLIFIATVRSYPITFPSLSRTSVTAVTSYIPYFVSSGLSSEVILITSSNST